MTDRVSPPPELELTVAICTYNGESRLPEVLRCLDRQSSGREMTWEVLIIDNNSDDQTAALIHRYAATASYPLRYVFEPRQGLAFARQAAIEQARSPLVAFIDDDNLPDRDWVAAAIAFAREHPQAGAYGGAVRAQLEGTPPEGFKQIAPFLAIVERGDTPFIYQREQGLLPPGAGLVARRQAWLDCVPSRLFLTGRSGSLGLASEDLEAIIYLQNAGWEIWHNPDMKLAHKIPNRRLERHYLLAIARGVGLARYHIRRLRLRTWQQPLFSLLYFVNDLRRALCHYLLHHNTLKTDLAAACKMTFLIGSLIGPWVVERKSWELPD